MRSVPHLLFLLLYIAPAHGFEVTVFTAEDLPPLRGLEHATAVYTLGTPDAVGAADVANPGDTEQAKREALDRLNSPTGRAVIGSRARQSHRGGDGATPAANRALARGAGIAGLCGVRHLRCGRGPA